MAYLDRRTMASGVVMFMLYAWGHDEQAQREVWRWAADLADPLKAED